MRMKGTKYPTIDKLPSDAKAVSIYAKEIGTAVGYVYIKYDRWLKGETTTKPDYSIRCFQGVNFVITE